MQQVLSITSTSFCQEEKKDVIFQDELMNVFVNIQGWPDFLDHGPNFKKKYCCGPQKKT
jgi:hypothetical protein